MDADLLAGLRALVDQHRLRIVARLAGSPETAESLAAELRQPVPVDPAPPRRAGGGRARRAALGVGRERSCSGRGSTASARWAVGSRRSSARRTGFEGLPGGAWPHDGEPLEATLARLQPTPDEAKTLRAYLVDGRLTTIPAQPKKRDIVLRFLLERVFTEDRDYPEKEVNQRLALFHPDVAALRRYLYDEGYVDRDHGQYRRADPRA